MLKNIFIIEIEKCLNALLLTSMMIRYINVYYSRQLLLHFYYTADSCSFTSLIKLALDELLSASMHTVGIS